MAGTNPAVVAVFARALTTFSQLVFHDTFFAMDTPVSGRRRGLRLVLLPVHRIDRGKASLGLRGRTPFRHAD